MIYFVSHMGNKFFHIGIVLALVVLLILLCDPFMLWMPGAFQMMVLLGAAVCAILWSGFVMYEKATDERELQHSMFAGRVAYLLGVGVLTVALLVQGFQHSIDPWILAALGVMVVSKLAARLYAEHFK